MTKGEQFAAILIAIVVTIVLVGLMISTTVGDISGTQQRAQFAIACLQAHGTPVINSQIMTCIAR